MGQDHERAGTEPLAGRRGGSGHRPQVPVGLPAQLAHERVDDALLVLLAAVGDRPDHRPLALQQRRDRLVDRLGGEQVVGVDGVALADPVAAILGLVVLGRGPVELQERDVRGTGQRQALAGDLDRADDQLVAAAVGSWKQPARARARRGCRRRGCGAPRGSARARRAGSRGGARTRPAARPRSRSRGSRPAPRAACRAPRAASGRSGARGVRRAGPPRPSRRARAGRAAGSQPGHEVALGQPVLGLVVELDGTTERVFGRQLGQHVGLQPAHEAARAQVPVQAQVGVGAAEALAELRPRSRTPRAGRGSAAARSARPAG